jgi:hypothetical protein
MTQEPTSPAPEPAHTGGTGSTGGGAAALQSANRLDLGIIGAGIIAFLASLMPYYTVSFKAFGISTDGVSFSAWHGALLALAAAVVLVLHLMGQTLPFPVRTTVLGLMAGALLCTVLALFIFPGGGGSGTGHGFGYWLALLATIAGTVLAGMRRGEA